LVAASPEPTPTPAVARIPAADLAAHANPRHLALHSEAALVMDADEGLTLYGQQVDKSRPIASLTKLMTAMVVLDAGQSLDEPILVTEDDRDRLRGSRSRIAIGTLWTRRDLLIAALGASDNRAASALARAHPGGRYAFLQAMNDKAAALGLTRTRFADASGLNSDNVSTARDLAVLARAAREYPLIREITTKSEYRIAELRTGSELAFPNTNRLVRNDGWQIGLSKTGYTADAGNCLVMQATIGTREVVIVLLNSWGWLSKYGDSSRIRDWLLRAERQLTAANRAPAPHT
jgi:D-alanyl-D-alanine endopeptidase (penicillin-binding protein 7)